MPSFDPASLPARVLHKDRDVIVIDKPPGIAVHKGAGHGDDLERSFDQLRFEASETPALAHRLDKDTSGCLVLGRNREALKRLGALFSSGRADKTYWAVVVGRVAGDGGVIDAPLARRSADRRSWWMKVDPAGDASLTRWRVLGRADGLAWLELSPETGRTHQLRVHCAHSGWPSPETRSTAAISPARPRVTCISMRGASSCRSIRPGRSTSARSRRSTCMCCSPPAGWQRTGHAGR